MKKRFVILDRDGTVIVDKDHLTDPQQVELIPKAATAIKTLNDFGLGVIIVTNQTVVGNRHISLKDLESIHKKMLNMLSREEATINSVYVCPHKVEDNCSCRKPKSGLIEQALKDHDFDPKKSFMVGDKKSDIELGKNIGATTILVRTGYGKQTEKEGINPNYVVDSLEGILFIVKNELAS